MMMTETSNLTKLLDFLRTDKEFLENTPYWVSQPALKECMRDFPLDINPSFQNSLERLGISSFYSHQAEAIQVVMAGQNCVITTGTASGKSLCYQIPLINQTLQDGISTSLLLFPTKALAADQMNAFRHLMPEGSFLATSPAIYDGDTPQRERQAIRTRSKIVLSNPDMLNLGILPNHTRWAEFFQNLHYIVLDEIHIYRGVFGSHVANVIRRLKRICQFYGSKPVFILTSATIHNAAEHAQKLIELPVVHISDDGAPKGERHFLVYNPPLIMPELGVREGLQSTTLKFLIQLYSRNVQTLVFCRTRRFVELLLREARMLLRDSHERIRGYRSGYLKTERREIENGLRSGEIRCAIATNALELGVDIGGVDAVLLPGYPGSIASLRQRAGRAGRESQPSMAIFIASMNPLDQYLTRHPEYLVEQNPEQALINADNPLILMMHLQCAAAELPFRKDDIFGAVDPNALSEYLDFLVEQGVLFHKLGQYHWVSDDYPSAHVSLRSASNATILLEEQSEGSTRIIGEVDYNSGLWMVHPGAVYIHSGETYRVEKLDLDNNIAQLIRSIDDYITEPVTEVTVEVIQVQKHNSNALYERYYGEVVVHTRVTGFKRVQWQTRQVLDINELDLPETTLRTSGYWIVFNDTLVEQMKAMNSWQSEKNDYGVNWNSIRETVRKRDSYTCQVCGVQETIESHHVHHKVPFKRFLDTSSANVLSNLVTLCQKCHAIVESQVRVRSAASGVKHLFENLSPLLVMCDQNDIVAYFDPAASFADKKPAIIFHDAVPAGIGLCEALFERFEQLVKMADETITTCTCNDGCPACCGPAPEDSVESKQMTKRLIALIQEGL